MSITDITNRTTADSSLSSSPASSASASTLSTCSPMPPSSGSPPAATTAATGSAISTAPPHAHAHNTIPSSSQSPSLSSSPTPPPPASLPAASSSAPQAAASASSASPSTASSPTASVSLVPSGSLLDSLLARRALLEDDLRSVERQLVELEESYMDDTAAYGNVVKGWEGFLSSKMSHKHAHTAGANTAAAAFHGGAAQQQSAAAGGAGGGSGVGGDAARRSRLPLRDRLFSSSSSTAPLRATGGSTAFNGTGNGGFGVPAAGGASPSLSTGGSMGGFSLSVGELDLSGGLVGLESASLHTSATAAGGSRRSTGRRGGMDTEDASG